MFNYYFSLPIPMRLTVHRICCLTMIAFLTISSMDAFFFSFFLKRGTPACCCSSATECRCASGGNSAMHCSSHQAPERATCSIVNTGCQSSIPFVLPLLVKDILPATSFVSHEQFSTISSRSPGHISLYAFLHPTSIFHPPNTFSSQS